MIDLKRSEKLYLCSAAEMEKLGKQRLDFPFKRFDKKEGIEKICCLIFMCFLWKRRLLNLPFEITYNESPDFRLRFSDYSIGLEVTIATTISYQHASAIADKEFPEGSLIEMSEYWTNSTSKDTVHRGIRKIGEPFQGSGWTDWGQEKKWIECVEHAIKEKTVLLNKPHFEKHHSNQLVIYDDTPTVCPDLDYAISQMSMNYKKLNSNRSEKTFNKIHVITGKSFLYNLFGNSGTIDV